MAWRNVLLRVGLTHPRGHPLCVRGGAAVKNYCGSTVCVPSKPARHVSAGVVIVSVFSIPFITVGAYAAKMFASGLEDFDLFVPDDDDD